MSLQKDHLSDLIALCPRVYMLLHSSDQRHEQFLSPQPRDARRNYLWIELHEALESCPVSLPSSSSIFPEGRAMNCTQGGTALRYTGFGTSHILINTTAKMVKKNSGSQS